MRHRQVYSDFHPVSLCFIVAIARWSACACNAVSLACRLFVTQTITAADIKLYLSMSVGRCRGGAAQPRTICRGDTPAAQRA